MKRILHIVSTFAAVMLVSCNRESFNPAQEEILVFSASWGEEAVSKSMIDPSDSTKVLWSPDEYFRVYSGSMSGIFYSMNAIPERQIEIRGGLAPMNGATTGSVGPRYWAVYPDTMAGGFKNDNSVVINVSSRQQGADSTFANHLAPAIAVSKDFHFTFYNVCGGIRFTVSEPGIQVVKISSVNGEPLAGSVTVEMVNDRPSIKLPVQNGKNYVILTAPEGGFVPGVPYYAIVLPGTLSKGIAFSFVKSGSSALSFVNQSLTVQRARIGVLNKIDDGHWKTNISSPQWVDLGFGSVLWADCNLGASRAEQFGNYYAWGETETKNEYTWENYKFALNENEFTKYVTADRYGTIDNKINLEAEDDAVTVALGDGCRIPTEEEWRSLIYQCTVTRENLLGIAGLRFTSNVSGYQDKSIFLPITGNWMSYTPAYIEDGENPQDVFDEEEAFYSMSRIGWGGDNYAGSVHIYRPTSADKLYVDGYRFRHLRFSIRPVKNKNTTI